MIESISHSARTVTRDQIVVRDFRLEFIEEIPEQGERDSVESLPQIGRYSPPKVVSEFAVSADVSVECGLHPCGCTVAFNLSRQIANLTNSPDPIRIGLVQNTAIIREHTQEETSQESGETPNMLKTRHVVLGPNSSAKTFLKGLREVWQGDS
jgi:hypothetical protein